MSTRSNIAIETKSGKIKAVFCHWDGYVSWTGHILSKCYAGDVKKIKKLIALGDLESVGGNIGPEADDMATAMGKKPEDRCVKAVARDCDKGKTKPVIASYPSRKAYLDKIMKDVFIEYVYIFDEKDGSLKAYANIGMKSLPYVEIDLKKSTTPAAMGCHTEYAIDGRTLCAIVNKLGEAERDNWTD